VGVIALALISMGHLRRAVNVDRSTSMDSFTFLVSAVPIALLVPATLGVVLESPFGAVPFYWCIGALLALHPHASYGSDDGAHPYRQMIRR
jgi:hypothetical protein